MGRDGMGWDMIDMIDMIDMMWYYETYGVL